MKEGTRGDAFILTPFSSLYHFLTFVLADYYLMCLAFSIATERVQFKWNGIVQLVRFQSHSF